MGGGPEDAGYDKRNPDGNLNVPYLNWNDGQWILNFNWIDNDWNENARLPRRKHFHSPPSPGEFIFRRISASHRPFYRLLKADWILQYIFYDQLFSSPTRSV